MQPDPQASLSLWVGPPLPVPSADPPAPQRPGLGRRALGWCIDFLLVMVPGLLLIGFAVRNVVQGLPEYLGGMATEIGVPRLVGLITGGGAGEGIGSAVAGSWQGLVRPIILALLAVPLLQFAYHLSLLAWRGRTVGKMITDTRVGLADPATPARFAVKRAFAATLVETGPVGFGLALVVYGELSIGGIVLALAIVAWWVNVLPIFGSRHRTVVDRVSGTVVVHRALYSQVAARTADLARRTSDAAVVAGQRGADLAVVAGQRGAGFAVTTGQRSADAAVVAGRMGADAAVVAAQLAGAAAAAARQRSAEHIPAAARRTTDAAVAAARITATAAADAAAVASQAARQRAGQVIQTAPVQQALNSKVGQQSQALGAAGAQRARKLGGLTAGLARNVGDRTQQLWQERQAARAAQQPPAAPGPDQSAEAPPAAQYPAQPEYPAAQYPAQPEQQQPALPAEPSESNPPSQYFPTQPEQWRHPLP